MTLIVSAGNEDYIVLAADQLLTRADASGNPTFFEDKSNKMTVLDTIDARVAIAYTGLAQDGVPKGHQGPPPPGAFSASYWIVEALCDCAEPDRMLEPMLFRLRDAADERFSRLNARGPARGIAIVIVGYRFRQPGEPDYRLMRFTLTNMHGSSPSGDDPFVLTVPEPLAVPFAEAAGYLYAWQDSDEAFLRKSADNASGPADPNATVQRAAHTIRSMAARPASRGAIGAACSTIYISANPKHQWVSEHHPVKGVKEFRGVNEVTASAERIECAMNLTMGSGDGSFVLGPKLARNELCWCGSGKKYKRCHGA